MVYGFAFENGMKWLVVNRMVEEKSSFPTFAAIQHTFIQMLRNKSSLEAFAQLNQLLTNRYLA